MKKSLLIALVVISCSLTAQNSPPFTIDNSNWVATDALGRVLPTFKQTGASKHEKWVGLFYYIWHGYHSPQDTIYDITKILAKNPVTPEYGPHRQFHYWGEPEAGYYRSDDPWVIRRNIAMMAAAGVDFVYFDVTNAFIYLPTLVKYCDLSLEMRKKGINAPYISFATNARSGETINQLYDEFYSKKEYKDLWFYWEGKPLVLGQIADSVLRPEAKNFFNIKYSWAWTDAKNKPNHWQWIDKYPQNYGWSTPNVPDQMPVAVASHPISNIGNSYSNGKEPEHDMYKLTPFTGQGLHFAEQWKRALEVQPKIVMITQFNEWIAQRFINGLDHKPKFLGQPAEEGSTYFVDAYNEEFNRDVEPMKGGHTDNMYYQMVNYIRLFKGMKEPQKSLSAKINIDGKFDDWQNVKPEYRDYEGDIAHRDFAGANKKMQYVNNTGRNDIIACKVAYDRQFVYFYVKTSEPLTPYTDRNWMMLYLNTDTLKSTGWEGYDLLVNNNPTSSIESNIKQFTNGNWVEINKISYCYFTNELEIAVPLRYFKVKNNELNFSFHWTDNNQKLLDITEFFIHGESAPDRRFDYFFTTNLIK